MIVVCGAGVMMGLMIRNGSSPAPEAAQAAPLTKLPRPEVSKHPRPAEPETTPPAANVASESPAASPDPAKTPPPSPPVGARPDHQEMIAAMSRQMEESRTRKIDERAAALKARLNLTPDQEAKVRALLDKYAMKPTISGDRNHMVINSAATSPGGDENEQIAALLDPGQKEQFREFQEEKRRNRMEAAFGREFARLQEQLTLTPDQKDRVYDALGGVMNQEAARPDQPVNQELLDASKQARVAALRPILTPEQLAAYEANPPTPPFNAGSNGGVSSGGVSIGATGQAAPVIIHEP